ncbi:hypothetical protein [Nitrosomonas sp.]|uniref:hypothetical protein n=1 Tax=Nitrosomonas sp. TaxID=42353 RepID=UPI00272F55A6|nr:hypothetical protein [Nitrosomonas sp.]MDP2224881.1 hypothetical protein [Nitrosomonas sp.]
MKNNLTMTVLASAFALVLSGTAIAAPGGGQGKNGTTLAAYKTIDICAVDDKTWRYSGEISVWNEGVMDTQGFLITDWIQSKAFDSSGQFVNAISVTTFNPPLSVIPAGTTQETALTTKYTVDAQALVDSYIRNSAQLTITNHSGQLGKLFGPNPKATYTGTLPPPACDEGNNDGCTYTRGYWTSTPGVVWPDEYSRDALFFNSGKTWQEVLEIAVGGNGYYILAAQYIAAILNQNKAIDPAVAPDGVQDTIDLATAWFTSVSDAATACPKASSCGTQKTWAGVLDDFNNGVYPGGPPHCGD